MERIFVGTPSQQSGSRKMGMRTFFLQGMALSRQKVCNCMSKSKSQVISPEQIPSNLFVSFPLTKCSE